MPARPSRPVPVQGMTVEIQHLGVVTDGVIVAVGDGGRRLEVLERGGTPWTFTLRPTTGQFHAPGHGPRCRLAPQDPGADPDAV